MEKHVMLPLIHLKHTGYTCMFVNMVQLLLSILTMMATTKGCGYFFFLLWFFKMLPIRIGCQLGKGSCGIWASAHVCGGYLGFLHWRGETCSPQVLPFPRQRNG